MDRADLKDKLLEELKLYWIIALYLALLFGLLMVYRRLVLAEAGASYLNYGFAVVQALIIAKVILIGEAFGLSKRFGDRPLLIVAFVPFFAFWELGRVLGPHKLWALFFSGKEAPPSHVR